MKNVTFGVFLPTFWEDYGSRGIAQSMTEVASAASTLGYDSVWACDHIAVPPPNAGSARCLEPLILMSWLAQQFPDLVVATDVLVLPQRNALVVAKQVATLSVLTGGRFILGIGAGWNKDEFDLLGADFERRGAHVDEAVAMMRALWRETPVTFEGAFYQLKEAYFHPVPQENAPPVWVGGFSRPAVSRAARLGDGWMPFWGKWEPFTRDLDRFRAWVDELRSVERGRKIRIAANVPVRISPAADAHATDTAQPLDVIAGMLREYQRAGLETVILNIQSNNLDDYLEQMRLAAELASIFR